MAKIVSYEGNDEILVCSKKHERQLLADYFHADTGRILEDYDRDESTTQCNILCITNRSHLNFE